MPWLSFIHKRSCKQSVIFLHPYHPHHPYCYWLKSCTLWDVFSTPRGWPTTNINWLSLPDFWLPSMSYHPNIILISQLYHPSSAPRWCPWSHLQSSQWPGKARGSRSLMMVILSISISIYLHIYIYLWIKWNLEKMSWCFDWSYMI